MNCSIDLPHGQDPEFSDEVITDGDYRILEVQSDGGCRFCAAPLHHPNAKFCRACGRGFGPGQHPPYTGTPIGEVLYKPNYFSVDGSQVRSVLDYSSRKGLVVIYGINDWHGESVTIWYASSLGDPEANSWAFTPKFLLREINGVSGVMTVVQSVDGGNRLYAAFRNRRVIFESYAEQAILIDWSIPVASVPENGLQKT